MDRRTVLRAGGPAALGISTVILPSGAVHATNSQLNAAPTPVDFTGTSRLAYWNEGDARNVGSGLAASVIDASLSGLYTASGLTALADATRHRWSGYNEATLLDRNSAPYLQFALTTSTSAVSLAALAIHGYGTAEPATIQTVVSSQDGYGAVLRQFSIPTNTYYNIIVNLTGLATVSAGSTVALRLYFHNGYADPYLLPASGRDGLAGEDDAYNAVQGGTANVSIIGTIIV